MRTTAQYGPHPAATVDDDGERHLVDPRRGKRVRVLFPTSLLISDGPQNPVGNGSGIRARRT